MIHNQLYKISYMGPSWLKISAACFLLTIFGCSATPVVLPEFVDWTTRKISLQKMDKWEFAGRIVINSGSEGFTGRVRWHQDGDYYSAILSGPFGSNAIHIDGAGVKASLIDKRGDVISLADAENDLNARYGWAIPITSLRFWILGIPDPTVPAEVELNKNQQLNFLRQRGWDVAIDLYASVDGQLMPKRLKASMNDNQVRVFIDKWSFYSEKSDI